MQNQFYKMPMSSINKLFDLISAEQELYLPLEKNGKVQFAQKTQETTQDQIRLDVLNTVKSAKDLFFPQSENLVAFKNKGKKIDIIENREQIDPFVVFGVRACDAKSFEILDLVFLSDPVDTYYAARRKQGTVITLGCNEPEETCFCKAFDIDAAEPGADVETWIAKDILYWHPLTEKGENLTQKAKSLFETDQSDSDKETAEPDVLTAHKKQIREIIDQLPFSDLSLNKFKPEALKEIFESPKWQDLSQACIGCGTCTFICPTCQCYDIRDYDTGNGVQRYRCWDSCMYSDFVTMAHGNPRTSQIERFRQRFMHKLVYFPANNDGEYSCVGCGRCLTKCPSSMNIVKVIKTLGGAENV